MNLNLCQHLRLQCHVVLKLAIFTQKLQLTQLTQITEDPMNISSSHWMIRQGDVVVTTHVYNEQDALVPVGPPTAVASITPRDPLLGVVLQAGKVTGHHHHFPEAGAVLCTEPSGARKLEIVTEEPLKHEEHAAIVIPEGIYAVGIQVEYVPGDLPRQVED